MEFGRNSAKATFVFEVGADFNETFEIEAGGEPVDLAGSSFVFEIRNVANSDEPLDTANVTVSGNAVTIFYSKADIEALTFGKTEAEVTSRYHGRLLWADAAGAKRRPLLVEIIVSAGIA